MGRFWGIIGSSIPYTAYIPPNISVNGNHVLTMSRCGRYSVPTTAHDQTDLSLCSHRTSGASKCLFPWINSDEWKAVCAWLFSGDSDSQRAGVSRVAAWRAKGSIPGSVEVTADIVECQISEKENGNGTLTGRPLALMYAMAVTRSVHSNITSASWSCN